MPTVTYGGKNGTKLTLVESVERLVVRTANRADLRLAPLSVAAREAIDEFVTVARFRRAGVEVLQATAKRQSRALRDEARTALKQEPAITFAGRVLVDKASEEPVVYTENFFVKFYDEQSAAQCTRLLKSYGLAVRRPLAYARNAFFVSAPENTGQEVFKIAERLLDEATVELCHPEMVREVRRRAAFPGQWHLKKMTVGGKSIDAHARVEAAWAVTRGEGTTIAVIDDGVDIDHEEFSSPGKIVAARNASAATDDPRPGQGDDHGTACAGVAAADGKFGASGVAPAAKLMPIRMISDLGSLEEADAFQWAADHGADVISCSWGPQDGKWWDPQDPGHNKKVPLPDSTRLAIEYALTHGRNGRGCVVTWAAGNGNESVDNDGYASYPGVIAVTACNDAGKKSAYSDFGKAAWCAFPSNDTIPVATPGIFTTDRTGAPGYNRGLASLGDVKGNYTNNFGGTSSACPGAAGVAALVLSRNPGLRHDEVKDVFKRCCEPIDPANGNYDANGHSAWYGYGRLDAKKAVDLALPAQPQAVAVHSTVQDVAIPDLGTAQLAVLVAETSPLKGLKVTVDLEHTYIGDLVVRLLPPAGAGAAPVVLHDRQGGGTHDIKKTYDSISAPGLLTLIGKVPKGTWTLKVEDKEKQDKGVLRSVKLELSF
jgi:subtilisin family serine protease